MALEIALEKWLVADVKKRGGACIKLGFLRGIPDRMVLLPGGVILFVELKTPINKLSDMQIRWVDRLNTMGFMACCLNNKLALTDAMNAMTALKKTAQ